MNALNTLPLMPSGPGMRCLEGVRVLDFTTSVAGPYGTLLLADLGAEVIKIEKRAGGDDTRSWGPPFLDGESLWFLSMNRNKQSMTVDLTRAEGRGIACSPGTGSRPGRSTASTNWRKTRRYATPECSLPARVSRAASPRLASASPLMAPATSIAPLPLPSGRTRNAFSRNVFPCPRLVSQASSTQKSSNQETQ
ncbi:CoA transferase [Cupriavidus oxalaticus]|uniref:CoA transferase n=1 Tax=Cupriavidus oxalaticus TaxID=96344 RepID=UPI003D174B6E